MRIAKVAITNVAVWLLAWYIITILKEKNCGKSNYNVYFFFARSPYAFIAVAGQFGGAHLLTPLMTQVT